MLKKERPYLYWLKSLFNKVFYKKYEKLKHHSCISSAAYVLKNFLVTVKAAPNECIIRTGLPWALVKP